MEVFHIHTLISWKIFHLLTMLTPVMYQVFLSPLCFGGIASESSDKKWAFLSPAEVVRFADKLEFVLMPTALKKEWSPIQNFYRQVAVKHKG